MVYNAPNSLDKYFEKPSLVRAMSRSASYTDLTCKEAPDSQVLGLVFSNASDSNLSCYSFGAGSKHATSRLVRPLSSSSSTSTPSPAPKRKSSCALSSRRNTSSAPLVIDTNGPGLSSSLVITGTDSRQIAYTTPGGSVQLLRLSKLRNEFLMKGSASQILPFLYLGNKYDAHDISYLQSHSIRYVLNISRHLDRIQASHRSGFECKYIHVRDDPDQEIMFYFQAAFEFIEKARNGSGNVLVHCSHGISRSPTIVIAYLMKYAQFSLTEAFDLVKAKRPGISPNIGFYAQLKEYETLLFGQVATR